MPPVIPLIPQLYLKIGGADVPGELSHAISRVDVDLHLYLPDMFVIEIHDERFRWIEHSLVKIGQLVEVAAQPSEDEQRGSTPLVSGEIVAIEAAYPESGTPTITLRGYDQSHRLHRGRKVREFVQKTDSDIVSQIARANGLAAEVDSLTHVHEHLYQENLTDYEFLARRARALGCVFQVEGRKLRFRKHANVALPPVTLDYPTSLREFRPRLTASAQVQSVSVRSWDAAAKREIVGNARAGNFSASKLEWNQRGHTLSKQAFGDVEMGFTDEPVASQAEGETFAVARLSRFWSSDVQADGDAAGKAEIRAGSMVKIEGVGDRFGGEYFVTHARHTFRTDGPYRTTFTIGGDGPDTTVNLLMDGAERVEEHAHGVTRGLVVGIVSQNKDPENRARVKVKFPWLAASTESAWARIVAPMAGDDRGFFFIPEVNDEVLVGFEHGDFNRPYVLGALWNGVDTPPIPASEAVAAGVVKRIIKTRAGHIIRLDDTAGKEKIEIIDKTGKNSVIIDSAANKIEIKAAQQVSISAMKVEIEGTQGVSIKGAEIESAASARQKISGGIVEIN